MSFENRDQPSERSFAAESRPGEAMGFSGNEDAYLRSCLTPRYREEPESRAWNSDPAFRKVLDPLNDRDYAKASSEAETLAARYGDFATLYCWWGSALLKAQSFGDARRLLTDALGKTKQKFSLCNLLGQVEWAARNIADAVYWWAQGMHCQESLSESDFGGHEGAYLFLYYVATGCGLTDCASAFISRADGISPGAVRLNSDAARDLTSLAATVKGTKVPEVLKRLVAQHIEGARLIDLQSKSQDASKKAKATSQPSRPQQYPALEARGVALPFWLVTIVSALALGAVLGSIYWLIVRGGH
jgi:hypothetical protein